MPTLECVGGTLHWDVTDLTPPWVTSPPTIVFHHGIGIDSDTWLEWLPALADRYRLVRFDMRGFGRSSVPGPGYTWSLDTLGEDALAVARAAGAERFHLVGESIGGTVALALASRHRAPLLSVTACSTAHRGGSIQRVREWRQYIARHGMAAWSSMMMPLRLDASRVPEGMYRWFERVQGAASPDSTLDLADMLIGTDLGPELAGISTPVLLLAPAGSPFVPLEVMQEIHARVPGSELQVFAGARHALVCSHAPACARALRQFLERRELG